MGDNEYPAQSDDGTTWVNPAQAFPGDNPQINRYSIATDGNLKVTSFGKGSYDYFNKAFYSLDGGDTWTYNPDVDGLYGSSEWSSATVYFKDAFYLASSDGGKIYKSTDAISWDMIYEGLPGTSYYSAGTKTDKTLLFVGSEGYATSVFYTSNDVEWLRSTNTFAQGDPVYSVDYVNGRVLAITNAGKIYEIANVP
jgi:hypothetical protein